MVKMRAKDCICRTSFFAFLVAFSGCSSGPNVTVRRERALPLPIQLPPTTKDFAIPVLMYHRICPLTEKEAKQPLTRDLTVLPEDFEAQIQYLAENGFAMLSVYDVEQALLTGGELPEKAVALTFDDGYRDNFEHAFPILRRYGASATIFLVKDTVDGPRHLTWPMIRSMRSMGVRYGSHTVSHADLPSLNDARLEWELVESKSFLEKGLGETVTSLAYPAGRFDDRVVGFVQSAGYRSAWKKGGGPARPGDDPFRLPRVRVHGQTNQKDFERKVWSGYWAMRMNGQMVASAGPRMPSSTRVARESSVPRSASPTGVMG